MLGRPLLTLYRKTTTKNTWLPILVLEENAWDSPQIAHGLYRQSLPTNQIQDPVAITHLSRDQI